jgi:hypothetical protein
MLALRQYINDVGKEVRGFRMLANVPNDRMGNLRNEMYVISEAIRLIEKSGKTEFDARLVVGGAGTVMANHSGLQFATVRNLPMADRGDPHRRGFRDPGPFMKEWEVWDQAGFREEEARDRAKTARQNYVDTLREKLYNF